MKKIIIKIKKKERKNKIISETLNNIKNQNIIIQHIYFNINFTDKNKVISELKKKINGYKSQDIKKKLYTPKILIDREHILELLKGSQNICYYCKELVIILYENVREPKQWSLDRIDNGIGHNKGNVVIACLDCNLKRKTMYHERYAFTKQLSIVKSK